MSPTVRTRRLHLIAGTLDMAKAELSDRSGLSDLLDASLPDDWPPPLNDDDSAQFFLNYLTEHPNSAGWLMWYFIRDEGGTRVAIGNGGFKGEPSDGAVEIGYSLIPLFQRQGFASEAVSALVDWAFFHKDVSRIVAETLPELHASQRLLRKLGFREVAPSHPDVLRYELSR